MEEKTKKSTKRFRISALRHVVQIAMLLLFALPLLGVGWSLLGQTASDSAQLATPSTLPFFGSLSSSSFFGVDIVDPFAGLQVILASRSLPLDMLLGMVPVLLLYGLIRGRVFCGWVCPVNLLLELVDWLRKVLKIEVSEMPLPRHIKLWVALGVLVLSFVFCVPVFESLSPISAINKFILFGSCSGLITLIAIIIAELFWGHRVWCRSLCPLGAFYELLGKVGLVNVTINKEACIGCNKCKKACLCDPEILSPAIDGTSKAVCAGDCMLCGKCIDACPTKALKLGIGRGGKNES